MMGPMEKPDISLLEFRIIKNGGDSAYNFELDDNGIHSKIVTTVNIGEESFDELNDYFVYITITGGKGASEIYLSQEYVKITDISDSISIYSAVSIDKKYLIDHSDSNMRFKEVNIELSYTHKHPGEMGIGESLKFGTFFKTKIPLVDKRGI